MTTFRRALREVVQPGSTVVDVGSGTGVLAFMALELGARRVVALEQSGLARHAARIARESSLGSRVRFVQCDALTDDLPAVEADLVVCELLGHFGIGENLERALARVCRLMAKPDAAIVPNRLELFAAPVECASLKRHIEFWDRSVAGVSLAPLRDVANRHIYLRHEEGLRMLGATASLGARTLGGPRPADGFSRIRTELVVDRAGRMDAVMGFFRSRLSPSVSISTAPGDPSTHWGQVLFPVGGGLPVRAGDRADFSLQRIARDSAYRWSWRVSVSRRGRERLDFRATADEWE